MSNKKMMRIKFGSESTNIKVYKNLERKGFTKIDAVNQAINYLKEIIERELIK